MTTSERRSLGSRCSRAAPRSKLPKTVLHADLDVLQGLVAKNLLTRTERAGRARLGMLETIRACALKLFAADEQREALRERHCRFYTEIAERHGSEQPISGARRVEHLAVMDAEHENLVAASRWAIDSGHADLALAVVAAAGVYWRMRNRFEDALHWIEPALRLPGASDHPEQLVRVLLHKARCLWPVGRREERAAVIDDALAIARALGHPARISRCLCAAVEVHSSDNELEAAATTANDALRWALAADDAWRVAEAHLWRAIAATEWEDIRERVDEATGHLRDNGNLSDLVPLLSSSSYTAL
jgi:hypothetical protein